MARRHFAQGSKDFDLGRYDDAIKEYMAAYDAKPDPALLYNIAQVHKLAGHIAEAIRFYRVYLLKTTDAPNADEVRAKIAELQKALDQQQKAQAMPPDQVKPLNSVPKRETPPEPLVVGPVVETPPTVPMDEHPQRGLKIAGFVMAAGGVAIAGAGIGLSVIAQQDSNQLRTTDREGGVYDKSKDDQAKTFGVVGPALIGVGAVVAVAGGIVAIIAYRRSQHVAAAAVRNVASRGGLGFAF